MDIRVTRWHDQDGERQSWVASGPEGYPLGSAVLRTADRELDVWVHPAERRRGVGAALFRAVAADVPGALLSDAVTEGSDADRFCVALGLRPVLSLTYTRLELHPDESPRGGESPRRGGEGPDGGEGPGGGESPGRGGEGPVVEPVGGYRVVSWEGRVPDALAGTFARSRRAMDDMPMGESGYEPRPWDVARLHRIADAVTQRGDHLCTVAVLDSGGEIVGFTEVVVPGDGLGDGQHYGTGVLPEHRGRGLARWLKAESIGRVRARFPQLAGLLADTADDNVAMIRVNVEFGYRPTHRSRLYRYDGG